MNETSGRLIHLKEYIHCVQILQCFSSHSITIQTSTISTQTEPSEHHIFPPPAYLNTISVLPRPAEHNK